ncbi:hypothetical protein ACFL1K_03565 [Candidatus Omnitrophota bacterium]
MKNRLSPKNIVIIIAVGAAAFYIAGFFAEKQMLRKVIERLSADSRVAEVLVTEVRKDPATRKKLTTIKFLEYDTNNRPLEPKYFTFSDNLIQFQSLVIRFDDSYVKSGHRLKGKSAYIFMKAFTLKDKGTEVFEINRVNQVPSGYEVTGENNLLENKIWGSFWEYALDEPKSRKAGIKNAQLEAPGTKFIPGMLYIIRIEHDGGLRIDCQKLSPTLRGERLP